MARTTHPLPRPGGRNAGAAPRRRRSGDQRLRAQPALSVATPGDPDGPRLEVQIRRDGRRPRVLVSGNLDLAGQELIEAALGHVRTTHAGRIEVDLGQVSFADSHGLSPVLAHDVVLVAASPSVRRLLHLLGGPVPRSRAPGRPARSGRARRAPGAR